MHKVYIHGCRVRVKALGAEFEVMEAGYLVKASGSPAGIYGSSQNKDTPIWTPIYLNPYYGDPRSAPLVLGSSKMATWTPKVCKIIALKPNL